MENRRFTRGNIEVIMESTKKDDGQYEVVIRAEGNKAEVEAFMKDLINGTAELNLPIELSQGKVGEPENPLKVSELMGGN